MSTRDTESEERADTAVVPDAPPQPTDPDVDLHVPPQRDELRRAPVRLIATIAAGGVLGALARYGISTAFPHPVGGFPWATFGINVSGSFLLGALMVLVTERLSAHPLVRPFLGVGVLGGFTTFSTSIVDTQQLVTAGAARTALGYLAATLLCALAAAYAGVGATRLATRRYAR